MGSEGAVDTDPALAPGTNVDIRNTDGSKQRATIVRAHRNGEFTVKYESSGETEKSVSADRVKPASSSPRHSSKSSADTKAMYKVGDEVEYLAKGPKEGEKSEIWREAKIKLCRPDGTVDVVDLETDAVVRKLSGASVRQKKSKKKSKGAPKNVGDDEEDEGKNADTGSDEDAKFAVDALVEVQNKKGGEWKSARVIKARSDGSYDLAMDSDDEDVMKKVSRKLIRGRKSGSKLKKTSAKPKTKSKESDDDDDDDEKPAIRKRSALTRKSRRNSGTDDNDEDDGEPSDGRKQLRSARSRGGPVSFAQLRVNQAVEFDAKDGSVHRGQIKQLRSEDETCDVAHDSDGGETVSRKVPVSNVRTTSGLARMFRGPTGLLQMNTRVYYRGKDGVERKGIVLKVWKDGKRGEGGEPTYDVEDLADGEMFKHVPASKLRAVPWLDVSLPQWGGFSPGFPSFMSGPVLRRGVKVRFRRKLEGSGGRLVWADGVIAKMKADNMCVVEFISPEGKSERVNVKTRDVQAKFLQLPSLSLPALPGLSLPSIELMPQMTIQPGTSVEVSASGGEKVLLGTVLSYNESGQTYTIQYRDGSKAKGVAKESVRVSLRRLRVGTEVEMVVEGPCKEVSTLDGEVAWVHRDEKVCVRLHGGNNDVFAEVCPHALTVDGQPGFSAPLSSTWLELIGFKLNLLLEMFIYAWLAFGLIVEIGDMIQLASLSAPTQFGDSSYMVELYESVNWTRCAQQPLHVNSSSTSTGGSYLSIPEGDLETDRAWLVTLLVAKTIFTAVCVLLAARRVHCKLSALDDNYIDVKELQQDQVRRRRLGLATAIVLIVSYFTLLVYASLLSRFEYFCLVDSTQVESFDKLALDWFSRMFSIRDVSDAAVSITSITTGLASKTTVNLFRALALSLLLFALPSSSTDFLRRVLLILPSSIALSSLVAAIAIAPLSAFYLVNRAHIVSLGELTELSTDSDLAVLSVLVALWLNAAIVRLVAASGRFTEGQMARAWTMEADVAEDTLAQADRGEFGLQAKREAVLVRVEQRQRQLGALKLAVLRIHRSWAVHSSVMIVGIACAAQLQIRVGQLYASEADARVERLASAAVATHLGFCIAWLVAVQLASLAAVALRRQGPPELLAGVLSA